MAEETGAAIRIEKLPIGDPTLSDKELIGNESQERMGGLVIKDRDVSLLKQIAERERAPFIKSERLPATYGLHFKGRILEYMQWIYLSRI